MPKGQIYIGIWVYIYTHIHTHREKRERWIDLETPEKQWYDASPKADRLKTKKEPIFLFESEGKKQKQQQKNPNVPAPRQEFPLLHGMAHPFSSSQALDKTRPH